MKNNLLWQPQPKQALFMSEPAFEALYGGAAGGGKTMALVMEALRQVHHPKYRGLIVRKTYPQLLEIISLSEEYYPRAFPDAKYNSSKHIWSFKSGAKIIFASFQHSKDKINFQGQQYQFVGVDEATHFTLDEYMFLVSRCRARASGQRCYVRATANPGGVGHGWVKERFITSCEPYKRKYELVKVGNKEMLRDRVFIPATVFDNKALLENDPNYIASLAMLPEAQRNAFLYGNWDSFEGQAFTEWRNLSEHYEDRLGTHVIAPFEVPQNWKIYRAFDFGYSKPFSVQWLAVDHDNRLYMIAELYGWNGNPDVGVQWEPAKIASKIKEVERENRNLKGKKITGIADPAIWQATTGESIADMMAKEGVYWQKGDNSRLSGKMQYHYRLAFDENNIPMLYVFTTCPQFIRTFPSLVYDDVHTEDINTKQEDHAYDAVRYVLMENPINPKRGGAVKMPDIYNPFADDDIEYKKYNFFKMG